MNMPKSTWMILFYIFPFPHLFYSPLSTWTRDYLFERLQEITGDSLKEHEAVLLNGHNLIFFYSSCKYLICFFVLD